MSVYKSRRKDAAAEFIAVSRELRKATVRMVKKFPTSYRWVITNNMLTLANEVYTNALKANAIYVHKDMSEHDYELRHRYLVIAASSADYNRTFQTWTEAGNTALKKIRGGAGGASS